MTLKDYYASLEIDSPRTIFKEKVKQQCRISDKTFYNWLTHPERIPDWANKTIYSIKQELKTTS